jgi:hypothetical protein
MWLRMVFSAEVLSFSKKQYKEELVVYTVIEKCNPAHERQDKLPKYNRTSSP